MDMPLDNPVWHTLASLPTKLAIRSSHAARFVPDVAPFFAIDQPSSRAYEDVRRLLGASVEARFFRPRPEPAPSGWTKTFEKPISQMVLTERVRAATDPIELHELSTEDTPAMLALAEQAQPGPFATRTRELGIYLGIRQDGCLVAMAGERFRFPGYAEISGIATHPAYRGRGYARALTLALAARIQARGDTPILHVFPDNAVAAQLYRSIGFVERAELTIVWLAPA